MKMVQVKDCLSFRTYFPGLSIKPPSGAWQQKSIYSWRDSVSVNCKREREKCEYAVYCM